MVDEKLSILVALAAVVFGIAAASFVPAPTAYADSPNVCVLQYTICPQAGDCLQQTITNCPQPGDGGGSDNAGS